MFSKFKHSINLYKNILPLRDVLEVFLTFKTISFSGFLR